MGRQFVEKWVLNERDGSVNRELDVVRSGFPPASVSAADFFSGVQYLTNAASYVEVLSIATTKVFRLNRLIVDNDNPAPNRLILYNYPSESALMTFMALRMKIAGSETNFIDDLDVPFLGGNSGGMFACCATASATGGVWVRVQGILITSD